MPVLFIIGFIALVVVFALVYHKIMNRGKKCPHCGEKYDSSCVLDFAIASKSYAGKSAVTNPTGSDFTDVNVKLKCKKCGKEHTQQITIKSKVWEKTISLDTIKKYFDK